MDDKIAYADIYYNDLIVSTDNLGILSAQSGIAILGINIFQNKSLRYLRTLLKIYILTSDFC